MPDREAHVVEPAVVVGQQAAGGARYLAITANGGSGLSLSAVLTALKKALLSACRAQPPPNVFAGGQFVQLPHALLGPGEGDQARLASPPGWRRIRLATNL